jgi:hypothetical protein
MTSNKHRVPAKMWAKWSPRAREIFNLLYAKMKANQFMFLSPEQPTLPGGAWDTISWNAAVVAACELDKIHLDGAIDERGSVGEIREAA